MKNKHSSKGFRTIFLRLHGGSRCPFACHHHQKLQVGLPIFWGGSLETRKWRWIWRASHKQYSDKWCFVQPFNLPLHKDYVIVNCDRTACVIGKYQMTDYWDDLCNSWKDGGEGRMTLVKISAFFAEELSKHNVCWEDAFPDSWCNGATMVWITATHVPG